MEFIQQWYYLNIYPIFGPIDLTPTNPIEIDLTKIRREKKKFNCGNVIFEIEKREEKKKVKLWQSHCRNRAERRENFSYGNLIAEIGEERKKNN